jgi:hypothetical protein
VPAFVAERARALEQNRHYGSAVPAFVAERARALEQNRHYGSDVRQGAAFRTFDEICLTTLSAGHEAAAVVLS